MDDNLIETNGAHLLNIPYSMYVGNQNKKMSTLKEKVDENFTNDFTYKINQHGFRYNEPVGNKILLAVGCSITFGQGLPEENIYANIVSKELGYECVNVSLPGTGPDVQLVNATWALQKYKPEIVLFYMSTPDRRFLANRHGFVNHIPHLDNSILNKIEKQVFIMLDQKFEMTRILQVGWQMYSFIELCKQFNAKLYFRCWDGEAYEMFRQFDFINYTTDLGNLNSKIDLARDLLHAGIESHKEFAERILNVIRV